MSPTLIATTCGVFTAIGFGTGDWLTGKASKKTDKFELNLASQLSGTVIASLLLLMPGLKMPSLGQVGIMLLISVLITAAYLLFIKALSTGSVGIVVPLTNIYPLPALMLSIIFLGVTFKAAQIVAILTIVLGAALLAYKKNHKKIPLKTLHKETFLTLSAVVFYGLDFFFIGTLTNKVSWQVQDVITSVFLTIIAFVLVGMANRRQSTRAFKRALTNKTALWSGISFSLGAIMFYFGSHMAGSITIPTVLSSCAPLVASLLGAIYDKEKIGLLKRVGAVIVVISIIVLSVAK